MTVHYTLTQIPSRICLLLEALHCNFNMKFVRKSWWHSVFTMFIEKTCYLFGSPDQKVNVVFVYVEKAGERSTCAWGQEKGRVETTSCCTQGCLRSASRVIWHLVHHSLTFPLCSRAALIITLDFLLCFQHRPESPCNPLKGPFLRTRSLPWVDAHNRRGLGEFNKYLQFTPSDVH